MSRIHIIHENSAWTAPLIEALEAEGLPYEDWFLDEGVLDLSTAPPEGIFYNRMSASSHTRDHRYGPEYTQAVVAWLQLHGRRVLNGGRAAQLEVTKVGQYTALAPFGVRTPRTVAAIGRKNIVEAAESFRGSFITKHNRAGKGLGVKLFRSLEALDSYVNSDAFLPPIDGITLIQEYIESPGSFITRVEFVGQEFMYAVRVDTSEGFELCPADQCNVGEGEFCPIPGDERRRAKFEIIEGFAHPLIDKYERFMKHNDIHIAACEFIVDSEGRDYTYDVNMNVNYNPAAEAAAGKYGMRSIARYLGQQLARSRGELRAV